HFLFDLGSRGWWGQFPWEHMALWLIAGSGTGWLLGSEFLRLNGERPRATLFQRFNSWSIFSVTCAAFGLVTAIICFRKYTLPLGLFNSVSPSSAASDWLFGWALLAGLIG